MFQTTRELVQALPQDLLLEKRARARGYLGQAARLVVEEYAQTQKASSATTNYFNLAVLAYAETYGGKQSEALTRDANAAIRVADIVLHDKPIGIVIAHQSWTEREHRAVTSIVDPHPHGAALPDLYIDILDQISVGNLTFKDLPESINDFPVSA